jgi:hypothetical protein
MPGLTDEEYNRLIEAFSTLPNSYVNFIKTHDVKNITIGGCQISVCCQKSRDFAEEMIKWNGREEEIQELQKLHDMIYIAFSDDIYDIYIAGTKSYYKEGEILAIDHDLY